MLKLTLSDNRGTHGYGSSTTGTGVGGTHSSTHGPHPTDTANKLDPRVDSDLDGRGTTGGMFGSSGAGRNTGTSTGTSTGLGHSGTADYGTSTGPAPNTAGVHKSDMMNKVDPR